MPDPSGFLEHGREVPKKRPVPVRILDNREVYTRTTKEMVTAQASRCMDCGIPFCHNGCPLGNRIPEWNDLARTGRWGAAIEQLHATNNFPEFTGRLCPAPCEAACVLGIGDDPVTIKNIEVEIIDRAFDDANVRPQPAELASGKSVAVVGSGPAGLAAAQQLARAGHAVTVYERDDAPGGLLRYGIPDFKLEKHQIDRRIEQMRAEGVEFECDVNVGVDITAEDLRERHDAVILAVGALEGRETEQPGRELAGIHQAMEHLVGAN
ncbi:MAG TPA: FAD-dependent oxidoreductase, partial [Glycomyces sp.]